MADEKTLFKNFLHDLKNPIAAIKSYSDLVRLSGSVNERQTKFLERINHATRRLEQQLSSYQDLLTYLFEEEEPLVIIDIEQVIDEAILIARRDVNHTSSKVTLKIDSDSLSIKSEYRKVQRVLINVITNALRYNRPDGSITINATSIKDDYVQIKIQDEGIGIPLEEQQSLFSMSNDKRSERKALGNSLGLPVTAQILTAINGNITVSSTEGLGTTFYIDLPRHSSTFSFDEYSEQEGGSDGNSDNSDRVIVYSNQTTLEESIHKQLEIIEDRNNETIFSLFINNTLPAENRCNLYVYAHLETLLSEVIKDVQKYSSQLNGQIPSSRQSLQQAILPIGTNITVVAECEDVSFEPSSLTKKWYGDWTRFEFEFRPSSRIIGDLLFIRVSIQIMGIEIAHIKVSCEVKEPHLTLENPLEVAAHRENLQTKVSAVNRKIFISYSRKDQVLALKQAEEIERILGDNVFIDVKSLRAGDDWQYQIAKAIDDADVFHLLWSEHSASSEYCRYEWEYALKQKCPENMCIGVIRPIYWDKPIPDPPKELSHLHFEYIDL